MITQEPVDPSRPDQNSAWTAFDELLESLGGTPSAEERETVAALQLSDMDIYEIGLLTDLIRCVVQRARVKG